MQIYHPTIVSTNKSVIKEWKLYSNINSAKHLFCKSPVCAYRQPPNLKRMLLKSNLSRIPTLVGNSKWMNPRCQVCDILDTRNNLQIPGTSSTIEHGRYNCDSCNIVYLLMCSKCDSGYSSERHQTDYDLNLIIIKRSSETTAGVSRWLFISTNPTIRLEV